MKLEEIKKQLKNEGYFIYRKGATYELGQKKGEDFTLLTKDIDYITFNNRFRVSPIRYLLMQVNNQLLDPTTYIKDLSDVITVIDFSIFRDYDKREDEIAKHQQLLERIKASKSIFGKRKDFKLIYVKHENSLLQEERYNYYIIKDNKPVEISEELLDNTTEAVQVNYISDVRNALKDDMINQYTEFYEQEVEKWGSLK